MLYTASNTHIVRGYAEQIATQETFRLPCHKSAYGHLLLASASVVDRSSVVDVSWLPAAHEVYNISADIRDYVLAEVPIVEGDVPNRNMNCFLTSRLVEFLPQFGVQAYRTFVGKPVHYEHQHDDDKKAKGVIFDASMREVDGRCFVTILKGFDRTKDPALASDVLTGKRRGHSMSAWTAHMDCSHCGRRWDTSYENACDCIKGPRERRIHGKFLGKGRVLNSVLVYDAVAGFRFFESSSVADPASWSAHQQNQVSMGD